MRWCYLQNVRLKMFKILLGLLSKNPQKFSGVIVIQRVTTPIFLIQSFQVVAGEGCVFKFLSTSNIKFMELVN